MSTININVNNQRMMLVSANHKLVSGSQQFVRFHFTLDADWQELTVFAQFVQGEHAYNQYLDEDNNAFLPSEIHSGECQIALYGTGDVTIGTSNYLSFNVEKSIIVEDASSTDITPTLYQQLVSQVAGKISRPQSSPYGEAGQVLQTNGDGTTQWIDALTSIEDGSVTMSKLSSSLQDLLESFYYSITDDGNGNVYINTMPSGGGTTNTVLDSSALDESELS